MAFNVVQISFFVEHQTFALNERDDLLKDVVGCQVDLVDKYPISIFQGFYQVSLKEAEDQVAVYFVQVTQDVVELLQHFIPLVNVAGWTQLLDDFRCGLDETLQKEFYLSLHEVVVQAVQVGLILLGPWHLCSELLQEGIEEFLE